MCIVYNYSYVHMFLAQTCVVPRVSCISVYLNSTLLRRYHGSDGNDKTSVACCCSVGGFILYTILHVEL